MKDRSRKRGGRRGRSESAAADLHRAPYLTRQIPDAQLLSAEGLELIEHNADTILEEIGIEFRYEPAKRLFRLAGADLDGDRIRFPRGMCRSIIRNSAPSSFEQKARNPERNVVIGGKSTVFAPVYGPPFVRDLDGGRRYATIEDFRNFVKLAYMLPSLHHSGGTVCEPTDLPVNKRHFDMVYSHIKYSDKPFMGSVTHPDRAEDSVAMCRILFGQEYLEENTVLVNLINANSPMTFDETMLGASEVYARNNQASIVSPFILSGAMSPVTVAGTMAQILAEALAGMAFTQLVRPGSPVIFGTFSSSISMQSGAPTFGTPEPALVIYGCAELARRIGVPFRSGGSLCGSKITDAQAAYESLSTLLPTLMAGVNFVLHSAGWLEGGLVSGYEKLIMDADQLGMMEVFARGYDLSENGQALGAIREVGPGSHFLGCSHTQDNFKTAFYRSAVADNNSFEQWELEGSQDATARANAIWKQLLNEYQPPALDPAIDEALLEFIDKRKRSFADSNY
ncbi:MAG: trimethylamine methyltransferase family protein [Gammaproteobacteria bacterium]|nr:trimethylamine methyltransferase family protein [Gammaproteobacteria bacterium]MYD75898.1 trimethylamine methyltransferase family protein [Gammaproteobacteria bacterium]MYJ53080.1 trimethylamine methyltransferase family protein [Gammaproteobacteria bacterium]